MTFPAKERIYLLTENCGFFGQRMMPWQSMDVDILVRILSNHFSVVRATYADVSSGIVCPKNSFVIHSSSQQPEYKQFIDDLLLYLQSCGNLLVPSIHATRSHENKGYQELHRRLCGVDLPKAIYASKFEELDLATVKYPVVFKDVSGFGSKGVKLIRSEQELRNAVVAEERLSMREAMRALKTAAGNLVRKHVLRRKNLRPYGEYYKPLKRFVLQSFIPGLNHDFKVLAFQERIFFLRRDVRPNDFRASGSGRFHFEDPPDGLLDFAEALLHKFEEPYISLDICFDGSNFYLIEFQALHFGPFTLVESQKHFRRKASKWEKCDGSVVLEEIVGESLVHFLQREMQAKKAIGH